MAEGLRQIAALEDPVGEVLRMWNRQRTSDRTETGSARCSRQ